MRVLPYRTVTAAVVLFLASNVQAAPGPCPNKLADYEGYRVVSVSMRNPIGFLTPWSSGLEPLKGLLQINTSQPFSLDKLNRDTAFIKKSLESGGAASAQKVKLAYIGGQVSDCDTEAMSLRVSYLVFTNIVSTSISVTMEETENESSRPATTGVARVSENKVSVNPAAGFNATRGLYWGLNFATTAAKFHIQEESAFSRNSKSGHIDLGSSFTQPRQLLNNADLIGSFQYKDTPVGAARSQQAKLTTRFSASSKEFTTLQAIFRYGAALEGGHQQAGGDTAADTAALPPNSRYGALKVYAGATGRHGNNAFTASYGLQLGKTFNSGTPTFKKHIVDIGYITRIQPYKAGDGMGKFEGPLSTTVHRSLDLETRFTAGLIQDLSATPLAERFLGGNEVHPFVSDNSWVIQRDAYIRSIPENLLGSGNPSAGLGGGRFYSANLTLSWPIWGLPLLPKELAADASFLDALNSGFGTAIGTLADSYKTKDPGYAAKTAEIGSHATAVQATLKQLSEKLLQIPPATASQANVAKAIKDVQNDIRKTNSTIKLIVEEGDATVAPTLAGFNVPQLEAHAAILVKNLQPTDPGTVAALNLLLADIQKSQAAIKSILAELDSPIYQAMATRDLAPAHRVIDVFLHELNIYSIAPVALFDVARVWPAADGVRYAVGGGVRFSLVNVNFTAAYAFKANRVKPEGAGAVFFKLDVTSLFR